VIRKEFHSAPIGLLEIVQCPCFISGKLIKNEVITVEVVIELG
jgi:hypothetical protein